MERKIYSPGSYIQGKGEIGKLANYCKELDAKGAYILVDSFIYKTYKQEIEESFNKSNFAYMSNVFGGECSMIEINKHKDNLGESNVIIGIGGGKTLDTAKAIGYYTNMPVIIVPTAASTDAPCSRLSVIYTENGEFEKYLFLKANPTAVIMDLDVLVNAPARFLIAGIGDALATYYEAAACERSNSVTIAGGYSSKTAMALAELCRDTLLKDGYKAKIAVENKVCTEAVENIIEANTYLSGVGFESGGLAAAHAIHNGLTALPATHHMLHGEKVAFGTIVQLILENRSLEEIVEIIDFCCEVGLPTTLSDLGLENVSDEDLMKVAELSCAEGDTMGNMTGKVQAADVFAAIKTADGLAKNLD